MKYSTKRLTEAFGKILARFVRNWCAIVVNSSLERINLKKLDVANDDAATAALATLFEDTELAIDADDVHKAALVCGEAFVIVWQDEEGQVEAYYNDPRLCHMFYDEERPRQRAFAAKWWREPSGHWRITLYYPDRLEYYRTRQAMKEECVPTGVGAFAPLGGEGEAVVANPYGTIPVFHFRPDRRRIKSLLVDAIDSQDAINKLFSDMMVAAEFGAFRQRWVISNADLQPLKNTPNEVWEIPAADAMGQAASVGEFSETNLQNYLEAMGDLAAGIGTITSTPRHLLFGQGGAPSGEALISLEAPLNKKVQRIIDLFAVTWRKVAAFMLLVNGTPVEVKSIVAVFDPSQTVQPRTQAEIREINARAGIPLRTTLKLEGWTDKQLEDMEEDRRVEQTARQLSFADLLIEGERQFNAGPGGGEAA